MRRAYTNPVTTESEDARVHCAVLNVRPDTPTRPRRPTPPAERWRYENRKALTEITSPGSPGARSLRTQQRAYHPRAPRDPGSTRHRGDAVLGTDRSRRPNWSAFHPRALPPTPAAPRHGEPSRPEHSSGPPDSVWRPVLLRKEVIQPHLPVRLPCYDFVPIADPAFDGSLHKGWATGFGRYRLS